MELYIRLDQGQPVDHPMTKSNMQKVWPDFDFDNLPPEFARFLRVPAPVPGVYEFVVGCEYRWNGDQVEDHWITRPMTLEEKTAKQDEIKQNWTDFPSWTFNEETCEFEPPVPYPEDGNRYFWDESQLAWQQVES
jgi:hypothetical protein